jgi:hypothetical protein
MKFTTLIRLNNSFSSAGRVAVGLSCGENPVPPKKIPKTIQFFNALIVTVQRNNVRSSVPKYNKHTMRFFKSFLVLCAFLIQASAVSAQTNSKEPSMGDMFRQMQEMLQQFESTGGMSFSFPGMEGDSAGAHLFKIDTSMFSDPMFRTMPNMDGGAGGMADFFQQLGPLAKMLEGFGPFGDIPQTDDGQSRTEEDLLPEEQMREEEQPGAAKPKSVKPAPAKKEKKRETTRI